MQPENEVHSNTFPAAFGGMNLLNRVLNQTQCVFTEIRWHFAERHRVASVTLRASLDGIQYAPKFRGI